MLKQPNRIEKIDSRSIISSSTSFLELLLVVHYFLGVMLLTVLETCFIGLMWIDFATAHQQYVKMEHTMGIDSELGEPEERVKMSNFHVISQMNVRI